MKISILGLGWFGLPLGQKLRGSHQVLGTTRSAEKLKELDLQDIEVSVLNYPNPPEVKILSSEIIILNIPPFDNELDWFKSWNINSDIWMIFISSTSEKDILIKQENWIKTHFKKWTVLRFGGLTGGNRVPAKYLAGKKNLPGRLWPVKLLELNDAISFTEKVINEEIQNQTIDVYQKTELTREEYYVNYCRNHNLEIPTFDPSDNSTSRNKD